MCWINRITKKRNVGRSDKKMRCVSPIERGSFRRRCGVCHRLKGAECVSVRRRVGECVSVRRKIRVLD